MMPFAYMPTWEDREMLKGQVYYCIGMLSLALALTACGGGGSTAAATADSGSTAGVAAPAAVSVVSAN